MCFYELQRTISYYHNKTLPIRTHATFYTTKLQTINCPLWSSIAMSRGRCEAAVMFSSLFRPLFEHGREAPVAAFSASVRYHDCVVYNVHVYLVYMHSGLHNYCLSDVQCLTIAGRPRTNHRNNNVRNCLSYRGSACVERLVVSVSTTRRVRSAG